MNLHQKISACNSDNTTTFPVNPDDPDDPTDCNSVCLTCHPGFGGNDVVFISGQKYNPQGTRTDDPDAYGELPLASATSGGAETTDPEAQWSDLPTEHSRCRDCHTDYAENTGNHPIFVSMDRTFEEGGLILFDGTILCATCHDPHDGDTTGLLRMANTQSALCFSCHDI